MITPAIIRNIERADIDAVSVVCMASFAHTVADSLSEEGRATFANIAASGAILERMNGDNLMLVAEADNAIVGVVELKEGKHVAMLFVCPTQQHKGIGKALVTAALKHARVEIITVKASLPSVPAYQRYGFKISGDINEFAGLVYQPMEKVGHDLHSGIRANAR